MQTSNLFPYATTKSNLQNAHKPCINGKDRSQRYTTYWRDNTGKGQAYKSRVLETDAKPSIVYLTKVTSPTTERCAITTNIIIRLGGGRGERPCQTSRSTPGKNSWVKYRCSPFRTDKVTFVLHARYQKTISHRCFPNRVPREIVNNTLDGTLCSPLPTFRGLQTFCSCALIGTWTMIMILGFFHGKTGELRPMQWLFAITNCQTSRR